MKKLLYIVLFCFCFSATAQYQNGVIEVQDFNYSPPITDNNMSVAFGAPLLIDFEGGKLQAYVNGNPVSNASGINSNWPGFDMLGDVAVVGTDAMCSCDLADISEEIQFGILMNNETIVMLDIIPAITYEANSFTLISDSTIIGWATQPIEDINFTVNGMPALFCLYKL